MTYVETGPPGQTQRNPDAMVGAPKTADLLGSGVETSVDGPSTTATGPTFAGLIARLDAATLPDVQVSRDDALPLVKRLPRSVLNAIAADHLVEEVRRTRRWRALLVEHQAMLTPPPKAGPTIKHGSTDRRVGGLTRGCTCELCQAARVREQASEQRIQILQDRLRGQLNDSLERYAAELRIEWTAELLSTGFALPDGRMVLWGEATVQDHEQRAAMLTRNVVANAEAAARHRRAVAELKAAGASTLRALTDEAGS